MKSQFQHFAILNMSKKNTQYELYKNEPGYISEDPADYGSKGENWASEFVKYMKAMVTHPVYKGMPDAIKEDGKIQWEAPSNRSGGKYQYTNQKRRDWWRSKAKSIRINTTKDKWISKTAKQIHPTGEKPCKRCGTTLRIAYVYPQALMMKRLKKYLGADFKVESIEPIDQIIQKAFDIHGDEFLQLIPALLSTSEIDAPNFPDIESALVWIEDEYIPREPSVLSPGVMSNAPDRFDGFHSFNRCCRSKADKGRSISNLKSYSTDRRVFEYWSEGDWIAADRLMGLVRSVLSKEANADGGEGSPSADHIGPLSLGFCHRPKFRLLSKSANSAKNNRMTLQDVHDLISDESRGIQIASWYATDLWKLLKGKVNDEETALRLSKIMRDNQRNAMVLLSKLFDEKQILFLTHLLELDYADYSVSFSCLRANKFITEYNSIQKEKRINKYALEQKSRRFRIGFESLRSYREKENRHLFIIDEDSLNRVVSEVVLIHSIELNEIQEFNSQLCKIVFTETGVISDGDARNALKDLPTDMENKFKNTRKILQNEMGKVASSFEQLWEDDRYVRAPFDLEG